MAWANGLPATSTTNVFPLPRERPPGVFPPPRWPSAANPWASGRSFTAQCRFRKPLSWPDSTRHRPDPKVEADRFTIEHIIVSEQFGAIAAEGSGIIVTFDYGRNAKAPVPDELRAKIDAMEGR